ncbi:MAG: pyridine nucleotide-disulfide oxidoreductase, partial [Leptothrix sp. (in: b-proteobacteria)]
MARPQRLLLIGGGHAHVQVLRDWMAAPLAGVELTVVSPSAWAPYSGMVPGWLAGDYRFDQIVIDLAALCAAAGARLVIGEVAALEPEDRRVTLVDGQHLHGDQLSLNIGSTLTPPELPGARVLSMRPLGDLRRGWEATLAALGTAPSQANAAPLRLAAVGGGPAGAEALLAVCAR